MYLMVLFQLKKVAFIFYNPVGKIIMHLNGLVLAVYGFSASDKRCNPGSVHELWLRSASSQSAHFGALIDPSLHNLSGSDE